MPEEFIIIKKPSEFRGLLYYYKFLKHYRSTKNIMDN